jgi:hypothetical protein
MKLLLDANISWKLIKILTPVFSECTHVGLIDLTVPAKDIDIWNYASENEYIIITKDNDFLDLLVLKGFPHNFVPFLLDTKFIIYRFISFFPLTIIFCVYYFRKENPLPIMVGHFIINIATVFQIFIMSMLPTLYESIKSM